MVTLLVLSEYHTNKYVPTSSQINKGKNKVKNDYQNIEMKTKNNGNNNNKSEKKKFILNVDINNNDDSNNIVAI